MKFDKLLEKKGRKLSPVEQRAKSDVLSGLQSEGSESIGEKLAGLKAAPAQNAGTAHEMHEQSEEGQEPQAGPENLDLKPMEECSPEEIDEKIQKLLEYKKALSQNEQE